MQILPPAVHGLRHHLVFVGFLLVVGGAAGMGRARSLGAMPPVTIRPTRRARARRKTPPCGQNRLSASSRPTCIEPMSTGWEVVKPRSRGEHRGILSGHRGRGVLWEGRETRGAGRLRNQLTSYKSCTG